MSKYVLLWDELINLDKVNHIGKNSKRKEIYARFDNQEYKIITTYSNEIDFKEKIDYMFDQVKGKN